MDFRKPRPSRQTLIQEHLKWIENNGSLTAAIESREMDFSEAPIARFYATRCQQIAHKRTQQRTRDKLYSQRHKHD